jgi:hypothetical protein
MEDNEKYLHVLIRQKDYFQYLYEQEQKRAASIIGGAKVYIGFLVFIIGAIFLKVITADKIIQLFNNSSIPLWSKIVGISFILLSGFSLIIAFLFTILVLKVWSYERLCNPTERFKETISMTNQLEVLSKCLSDFAIVTSRNNKINNKRAKYLSYALAFLLAGSLFALVTSTIINFIT